MKNIIFAISFILLNINVLLGQNTKGRDFWVVFGANTSQPLSNTGFQIRVVAEQNTVVTLNFTNSSSNRTINVPAGTVYTETLSSTEKNAVYNATDGTTNKTLHITADNDIQFYILNNCSESSDITAVFPKSCWGTDYYNVFYKNHTNCGQGDGYSVIAAENGTQIFENGTLLATLNQGQVYTKYVSNVDLTGYHIKSNKPIAFFSQNVCVGIPVNTEWRSVIPEQLLPVNYFQTDFFVPVTSRGKDRIRIVASQNGTVITQTGGTLISGSLNLNAGQFVELEANQTNNGCYIQSNKPVEVFSYMPGGEYFNNSPYGDPSFSIIPSVSQTVTNVKLKPFIDVPSNIYEHWALIVVPSAYKNNTRVSVNGGAPAVLSGGSWRDNVSAGHSYYNMPLANNNTTTYDFSNSNGMYILCYGLGSSKAYFYLASSVLKEEENNERIICSQAYYPTDDARVRTMSYSDYFDNVNYGNEDYFCSAVWTFSNSSYNNVPWYSRVFINFDLSDYLNTSNTDILNTDIYLFALDDPNHLSGFAGHHNNRDNKHEFHRVTSTWNETTITWNNQPVFNAQYFLTQHIPYTNSTTPAYTDYVFNLNSILLNGNALYSDYKGIIFKTYQEAFDSYYRRVSFWSKDAPNPAKRPYLKVQYEFPMPTINFNSTTHTFSVSNNSDLEILFSNVQYNWTINGANYTGNSVVPVESSTYDAHLKIIITNNIGETCEYDLYNVDCVNENIVLNDTICDDDSYDFYGTILTNAGTYTCTIPSVDGCDTIVTLNLTTKECNNVQIDPPVEICADDEFILLKYKVLEGNLTCYSVNFNQKALSQGFIDIPCTNPNSSEEIQIPIPQFSYNQYVRPDYNYSFAITFILGNSTETHNLSFDVLYPSWVMQQKWNDVIALLNYNYNGGYEWSDYEWYINGAKIPSDRNSYIYTPDYNKATLEFGQEYRALLTRVDDGIQIFTCPLIPELHTDFAAYPTIVGSSSLFGIRSKDAAKVSLITVSGIKLAEYQLTANQESLISAPYAAGVYILVFEDTKGKVEAKKIVVK